MIISVENLYIFVYYSIRVEGADGAPAQGEDEGRLEGAGQAQVQAIPARGYGQQPHITWLT